MTTRQIDDPQIQLLHEIFWNVDRLQTYLTIARAANRGEIKRTDEKDATELMLQHAYELAEKLQSQFDRLQTDIEILFHENGWREDPMPAEEPAEERKAVVD